MTYSFDDGGNTGSFKCVTGTPAYFPSFFNMAVVAQCLNSMAMPANQVYLTIYMPMTGTFNEADAAAGLVQLEFGLGTSGVSTLMNSVHYRAPKQVKFNVTTWDPVAFKIIGDFDVTWSMDPNEPDVHVTGAFNFLLKH